MRYPEIKEGEKVDLNWKKRDFKMCCCDCGLVHRVRFAVSGRVLRMRWYREDRATGQIRRHLKTKIVPKNRKDIRIFNQTIGE